MRTFEEIKSLLEEAEAAAALSAEAKATAAGDQAAAATAAEKATHSAGEASARHAELAEAVKQVNDALAEIVAGDLGGEKPPEPQPSGMRRTAPFSMKR